jgi:hypothetical protein
MPPIYSEWAEIGDLLLISALWSTRTNVKYTAIRASEGGGTLGRQLTLARALIVDSNLSPWDLLVGSQIVMLIAQPTCGAAGA